MDDDPRLPLHIEKIRHIDALWEESRGIKTRSIAHLALISSGAIIVSVNALVPLQTVNGKLCHLWLIFASWLALLTSTIITIPYRFTIANYLEGMASKIDDGPGRVEGTKKMTRSQCLRRILACAAWVATIGGMILMLVFVGLNLYT